MFPLFPSVLHHPPWFPPSLFCGCQRDERNKAEQEARALCGDSASRSDKIAVIFFLQNQHCVCVSPYLHLHPWHSSAFIDAVLPFSFWVSRGVKCQTKEWDPVRSFSTAVSLSENYKKSVSGIPSVLAAKASSRGTIMGVQVKGSQINGREEIEILQTRVQANRMITTVLANPFTHPSSSPQRSGGFGNGNGVSRRHWVEAVTLKAAATGNESLKEKIWSFTDPLPYQLS